MRLYLVPLSLQNERVLALLCPRSKDLGRRSEMAKVYRFGLVLFLFVLTVAPAIAHDCTHC